MGGSALHVLTRSGDTEAMVSTVVLTLLALGAAATVLVVASEAGGRDAERPTGFGAYLGDVRSGVRTWRAARCGEDRPAPAAEPVDTTIDDFLDATTVPDPAYLAVEDLTETLTRARERAARGVQGIARR